MLFKNNFAVTTLCALIITSGCTVGPDYVEPDNQVAQEFTRDDQNMFSTATPEVEWWRDLDDEILNGLISQAVEKNYDLQIAKANVNAARAFLQGVEYEQYPIVTSGGSITHEESSEALIQGAPAGFDRTTTFYDAGLDAVWELDFFGRVKRSVESQTADYEAAVAEQRNVYVTVIAEVARTYMELRGAQYRLRVSEQNAENQRGTYDMTRDIMEGGMGTDLDVVRSRAQLESTLSIIPLLETEIARTIHRLSVLVGSEPHTLISQLSKPESLPHFPELLNIGNPAELLRRRPDIKSAERQLAAATARIGVATADLFPRVSLSGSVGYLATSFSGLGDSDFRTTSFGPFLTWPAFDLGRVRARIRAADASAEGLLAVYEQTVLIALEETENALVRFAKSRQRQAHLQIAAEASAQAVELARIRYDNGVDSFLNVLDAQRQLLVIQDQLAQSETDTGLALVALYKALGGGWENAVAVGNQN
jgi:multidrug efflux system outer membrane protein